MGVGVLSPILHFLIYRFDCSAGYVQREKIILFIRALLRNTFINWSVFWFSAIMDFLGRTGSKGRAGVCGHFKSPCFEFTGGSSPLSGRPEIQFGRLDF